MSLMEGTPLEHLTEDLEAVKNALAAFTSSEEEAKSVEPVLRGKRRALAKYYASLTDEQAAAALAGPEGELHGLLAYSGLRNLPRDENDATLAAQLRDLSGSAPTLRTGPLLAAMLLFQGFELPVQADLRQMPGWLLQTYVRFLLDMPAIFNELGDASRYGRFAGEAVSAIHRYVMHRPAPPRAQEIRTAFLEQARFIQVYFNELNLTDLYRKRAEIIEAWALEQGARLACSYPLRAPDPGRRLRVGILSTHFSPQTETYFMLAHFERYPRERSTLILYALYDERTPLSQYARGIADATIDLSPDQLGMAAERIRADNLDVLLIGSNITSGFNGLVFLANCRIARTQVISASSPVTSGLTAGDWYLSAEQNERAEAQDQYTERLYRMPGMLTRYAYHLDRDPRTVFMDRGDFGIPKKAPVFFSASNFYKVVPELSATWAHIMAEVPDARLVLMPFNRNWSPDYLAEPFSARVLSQMAAAGVDPDRVHIVASLPARADLHGIMELADVYLDSFPFAGACSLLDPLLIHLPLVARRGNSFRANIGAGMLQGIGLGDMAVADEEAYVARAVALGTDPALRKRERARIRAAIIPNNPVFDSDTGSRNLEVAFIDVAADADALDAAILRQPADVLRTAVERLAGDLGRAGNSWFAALSDFELIRQVVVPYFQSVREEGPGRMVDVGACVGRIAEPFLHMGWRADLFEPDPACREPLAALAQRFAGRMAVHPAAVSDQAAASVPFFQSQTGLSGLSPSPYGTTAATLSVPSVRLADFARGAAMERLDFLKIDTEGWDFDALRSHDFTALPPRLVMLAFGTEFAQQPPQAIREGIAEMKRHGYDALVFSYDDENFKQQARRYRLISAKLGAATHRGDGHSAGNILFFRQDDALFLGIVFRTMLGFLPGIERLPYHAGLQ